MLADADGVGRADISHAGNAFSHQRVVTGGAEVIAERQQRPVDDVSVRLALPRRPVPREEVERLWPIAAFVLRGQHQQQQLAQLIVRTECEQESDRALGDVARAPGATAVLLEPAGRQVVDERIVGEPGQHRRDLVELPAGRRIGRLQAEGSAQGLPEVATCLRVCGRHAVDQVRLEDQLQLADLL